ncbi:hypothetical protein [Flavobacterium succinicans]|uniref:hypothetical protein n=1 Tax=Flavobacterium succinicans TaxID=29536 RepID=UPI000469095B|nr:hypothetical protein [Flavobacterium succinicans]
MGFFDKLFGKKQAENNLGNINETETVLLKKGDKFVSTDDSVGYKILRNLTDEQKERIEKSTILLRTGQLYMHYWTDNLVCEDRNDQEWQNKVMYFWKAEELFPKKSLPSIFETFKVKNFLFVGDTSSISLQIGQAMPWFGMPGLGEKHGCEINSQKVTIPELNKLGFVEYVEPVELTNENLNILTDKENYFFLIYDRITPFQNGSFYLKDKPIPIDVAYSIGGIHIIKKTELE